MNMTKTGLFSELLLRDLRIFHDMPSFCKSGHIMCSLASTCLEYNVIDLVMHTDARCMINIT